MEKQRKGKKNKINNHLLMVLNSTEIENYKKNQFGDSFSLHFLHSNLL